MCVVYYCLQYHTFTLRPGAITTPIIENATFDSKEEQAMMEQVCYATFHFLYVCGKHQDTCNW